MVTSGLVIAATVGLTRVYLGVHYLSDVVAGWAVGVAAFSLCAVVAMLATHLRQNARTDGSPGPGEDRA